MAAQPVTLKLSGPSLLQRGTNDTRKLKTATPVSFEFVQGKFNDLFQLHHRKFQVQYLDADGDLITLSSDEELRDAIQEQNPLTLSLKMDSPPTPPPPHPNQQASAPGGVPNIGEVVDQIAKTIPQTVLGHVQKALSQVDHISRDFSQMAASHMRTNFPSTAPREPPGVEVHHGVECDRCHMIPIKGPRYKMRGRNYDLCQADFDKLSSEERSQYRMVRKDAKCPWTTKDVRCAARFVTDVSIMDGTLITPRTKFVKIWKLKNVGECPWPRGTRLLHVGGDKLTETSSVLVNDGRQVQPGDEICIAVEMTAPEDLGRHISYWRLTGPLGRKRFGQRLWCHIQVDVEQVDEDLQSVQHVVDPLSVQHAVSISPLPRGKETDQDELDNKEVSVQSMDEEETSIQSMENVSGQKQECDDTGSEWDTMHEEGY